MESGKGPRSAVRERRQGLWSAVSGRRVLVSVKGCLLAGVLFTSFTLAADPPSIEESASPAVAGDELENLDRGDDPRTAEPTPQRADPSTASRSPGPASRSPARSDRLELDTTIVTGNRELPKVLYIVPWKKAEMGELPAQPFNTLLDEVLTPVDRDVFRRELTYYDAVSSGGDAAGAAAPAPAERSEK